MPTGYTAKIADGITFNEFILSCARAFGVCIEMRDDPMDKPIPDEFKPSDYHAKSISTAKSELTRLRKMTPEQATAKSRAEFAKNQQEARVAIKKNRVLKTKYEAMLAEVEKWHPPTPDHEGMKKFMREQITESIAHDCGGGYYTQHLKGGPVSGAVWLNAAIARCKRDIVYHTKENREEIARAKQRTEWVRQLRQSLKDNAKT